MVWLCYDFLRGRWVLNRSKLDRFLLPPPKQESFKNYQLLKKRAVAKSVSANALDRRRRLAWDAAGRWWDEDGRVNDPKCNVVQVNGGALVPVCHASLWVMHKRDDLLRHAVALGDVSPCRDVAALSCSVDAKLVHNKGLWVHASGDLCRCPMTSHDLLTSA